MRICEGVRAETDEPPSRYFIDTNVFLSVGEPERPDRQEASERFLQENQDVIATGLLVIRELRWQLSAYPQKYRGARRVKQLAYACRKLDDPRLDDVIEALQEAYAERGWHGQAGDNNDRIHVATASAFKVPLFVTWEVRIRRHQEWIGEVNARFDLQGLAVITPLDD